MYTLSTHLSLSCFFCLIISSHCNISTCANILLKCLTSAVCLSHCFLTNIVGLSLVVFTQVPCVFLTWFSHKFRASVSDSFVEWTCQSCRPRHEYTWFLCPQSSQHWCQEPHLPYFRLIASSLINRGTTNILLFNFPKIAEATKSLIC